MKVKKYQAKNMAEAMLDIKKELGSEAVILQSRALKKGGFLGLFQKDFVEVVAALDEEEGRVSAEVQPKRPTVQSKRASHDEHNHILEEVKQLKKLISTQQTTNVQQFPAPFEYAFQYLKSQELELSIAERWIKEILEQHLEEDVTIPDIKQFLIEKMEKEINDVLESKQVNSKHIIQFVGPTGVGKTTTLAKVAAKYILQEGKRVAFITLDTYRIAAVEQLKTYATILNVPIEVAYTLQDYKQALHKFADYDFIFVDTAGRNFREPLYMKELKEMIAIEQNKVSTYLVLSMTAKQEDILEIYDQFTSIPIEKVVFTKMDETVTYGSMVNIIVGKQKSVAYVTNGQDVPDDLCQPSASLISQHILGGYNDE